MASGGLPKGVDVAREEGDGSGAHYSAGEGDGVEEGMDGEAVGFSTHWIAK